MNFCRGVPFQQEKLWNLQAKKLWKTWSFPKSTSQSDLESLLVWFWHLDRIIDTPDLWQMISWVSPCWHPIAHDKEQLSFEFYWLPFSFSILPLYFAVPNILCWTLRPLLQTRLSCSEIDEGRWSFSWSRDAWGIFSWITIQHLNISNILKHLMRHMSWSLA